MKIKVKIFDVLQDYYKLLSVISVITSLIFIFYGIPDDFKKIAGKIAVVIVVISYIGLWIWANYLTKVTLKINNSTMNIKIGDIFKERQLKVIAFNEYFDTQVDNKIISERSLNGMYINRLVDDVDELNNLIDSDSHLDRQMLEVNSSRPSGKKKKYKLGSIFPHNDYLLTAFTKFDDHNRAYLNMNDYINFLLEFWNEVDIIYASRSVSIPLLGSGITRFKDYNIPEQELLELLIWSFKVSRVKFNYPSKVSIVIHESIKDKINFYKLRG